MTELKTCFVMSDIHGMDDAFETLLKKWDHEMPLILLGDLMDRGMGSRHVLERAYELSTQYDVRLIRGNHDQMFLDYIDLKEKPERFLRNGGDVTLQSLISVDFTNWSRAQVADYLKEHYAKEITFLRNSRYFLIFGKVLFTHAGFNSDFADFQHTTEDEFIWIREHFKKQNQTPYVNVFGHTPTHYIHEAEKHSIWTNEQKSYIGIDGGAVFGGQLNGVLLDEHGQIQQVFEVKTPKFS